MFFAWSLFNFMACYLQQLLFDDFIFISLNEFFLFFFFVCLFELFLIIGRHRCRIFIFIKYEL